MRETENWTKSKNFRDTFLHLSVARARGCHRFNRKAAFNLFVFHLNLSNGNVTEPPTERQGISFWKCAIMNSWTCTASCNRKWFSANIVQLGNDTERCTIGFSQREGHRGRAFCALRSEVISTLAELFKPHSLQFYYVANWISMLSAATPLTDTTLMHLMVRDSSSFYHFIYRKWNWNRERERERENKKIVKRRSDRLR